MGRIDGHGQTRRVQVVTLSIFFPDNFNSFWQEDKLLRKLVEYDGVIRWCDVSRHFHDRSGKQCAERSEILKLLLND